jgi:hypothetical protein
MQHFLSREIGELKHFLLVFISPWLFGELMIALLIFGGILLSVRCNIMMRKLKKNGLNPICSSVHFYK